MKLHKTTKVFKSLFRNTLAPAGGFVNPFQMILGISPVVGRRESLKNIFAKKFSKSEVFLFNSGTTSLAVILLALRSRAISDIIAVSAYTCPDILAAIVDSGFRLRLIDVEQEATNISITEEKVRGCAAVILSNLYGIADEILSIPDDIFVIDDRCQAAFLDRESKPDAVILSFGRGKSYSSTGGGLLAVHLKHPDLLSKVNELSLQLPMESELRSVMRIVVLFFSWLLEHPALYSFVVRFPGLGLGASDLNLEINKLRASRLLRSCIAFSLSTSNARQQELLGSMIEYEGFKGGTILKGVNCRAAENVIIRKPFLSKDKLVRSRLLKKLARFGISASYPKCLDSYGLGNLHFETDYSNIENARVLAESIVTLPVTRFVTGRVLAELSEEMHSSRDEV